MDEASKSLKGAAPMSNHDFERKVYGIVPSKDGDYHFAESIVSGLYSERRRWPEVFKHMQANGMNIQDPTDDD